MMITSKLIHTDTVAIEVALHSLGGSVAFSARVKSASDTVFLLSPATVDWNPRLADGGTLRCSDSA